MSRKKKMVKRVKHSSLTIWTNPKLIVSKIKISLKIIHYDELTLEWEDYIMVLFCAN